MDSIPEPDPSLPKIIIFKETYSLFIKGWHFGLVNKTRTNFIHLCESTVYTY